MLSGSLVAIVTPFRDGEVDVDALRGHTERMLEGGSNGIVPCGTTGEAATLSTDEKRLVVQNVVEQVAGRVPVVAGVGTNNTRQSTELAAFAKEDGADAVLVVTPYYNKPNQEGLYQHFRAVAKAGMPQVVYNVPSRTSRLIEVATLARLAQHDDIIATKDATADMRFACDTLEACDGKLTLLSGDDFTTFPFLAVGGSGSISVVANVAPRLMADLCEASSAGDLERARRLQSRMLPLADALFLDTNPIPVKTALEIMDAMTAELRLPLTPLSEEQRESLARTLAPFITE